MFLPEAPKISEIKDDRRKPELCKNFSILFFCDVISRMTPEGASEAVELQIKEKEGQRILSLIRDDAYVIALAIEGKMLDSEELAERIEKLGVSGISQIVFVIGGSLGLSAQVMKRADYALSISRMTFPHQLMRVVLLEQIYRSYRIMNHQPYHK